MVFYVEKKHARDSDRGRAVRFILNPFASAVLFAGSRFARCVLAGTVASMPMPSVMLIRFLLVHILAVRIHAVLAGGCASPLRTVICRVVLLSHDLLQ